jgi:hypothetical protein
MSDESVHIAVNTAGPVPAADVPPAPKQADRRETDGWIGILVKFWNWVDARDIDKHLVSLVILYGTAILSKWAMHYAEVGNRPGLEVAAIIGAVTAPYMMLQAAAIGFYFKARQG